MATSGALHGKKRSRVSDERRKESLVGCPNGQAKRKGRANKMAESEKAKRAKRDGIYKRKDRPGLWISWIDAQGRRHRRKTDAQSTEQARKALSGELVKVEQAKVVGFTPPGEETFAVVAQKFLTYQKARLTPRAYEREQGIIEVHLIPFFACKLSAIRRVDIQRYVTKRSGIVSAHSVQKELNVIKH